MIIGQTVAGGTYLSPWLPRQGDAALFVIEVLALSSSADVRLMVYTKNTDEDDSAATFVNGTSSIAAVGLGAVTGTALRELVRFQYLVGNSVSQWVHFRVLPPAWRTNGA